MIPSLKDQTYIPQIYLSGDLKPKQQGTWMHYALQQLRTLPFGDDQLQQLNISFNRNNEKSTHYLQSSSLYQQSLYQLNISS
jgi:hypothetical protein